MSILLERADAVATVTLNKPDKMNALDLGMWRDLARTFQDLSADDSVRCVILRGAGEKAFSAGADIEEFERERDSAAKSRAYSKITQAALHAIADCRHPTLAQIHGACIAGGLMLAWCCDLIVASEDAFFSDPVVRMGIPGVEYFAHPWVLGSRFAKEILFTGDRFTAQRAYEVGMVNRVVSRADLEAETRDLAARVAQMPRFGLALTKKAVNNAEDAMGLRVGMDSAFGWHHVAHAHNAEVGADSLGGQDARSMRDQRRAAEEAK